MRSYRNRAFALLVLFAVLAGCGGGGKGGVTPTVAPSATPTPTPPGWTGPVPFTVQRVANLAASNALPNGGGFSGTLSTQALVMKYTQATLQVTNVAPQTVPADQTLAYVGLQTTLAVPAAALTISLQIPQASVQPNAVYYLAFYDPQRPSLGWQHGFSGPASVSTASGVPALTFTGNAPQLNRYEHYWLAVYMQASNAPAPTPAPSIAASVTPAPTPTAFTELQTQLSMKDSCSRTPCATGDMPPPTQGPQVYSVATAVPSPSHDGEHLATELVLFPQPNQRGDVLYFTPSLGEYPLATNFVWDFYVMIDQDVYSYAASTPGPAPTATPFGQPQEMAALEFDFNDASPGEPGFDYNLSSQCLLKDSKNGYPQWQIWGQNPSGSGTNWIDSGIPCYPWLYFTRDSWHHIQWTYRLHPDTLQTEYMDLTIDGIDYGKPPATILNPVQEIKKQAKATVEVQFQQDALPVLLPVPFKEWVDDVTLTFW